MDTDFWIFGCIAARQHPAINGCDYDGDWDYIMEKRRI